MPLSFAFLNRPYCALQLLLFLCSILMLYWMFHEILGWHPFQCPLLSVYGSVWISEWLCHVLSFYCFLGGGNISQYIAHSLMHSDGKQRAVVIMQFVILNMREILTHACELINLSTYVIMMHYAEMIHWHVILQLFNMVNIPPQICSYKNLVS